jgi:peptidoglycan hydrolase CwlO-like protein
MIFTLAFKRETIMEQIKNIQDQINDLLKQIDYIRKQKDINQTRMMVCKLKDYFDELWQVAEELKENSLAERARTHGILLETILRNNTDLLA